MTTGQTYQASIVGYAPRWLRNRVAGTILEAAGLVLDMAEQTLIEGLHASNPILCNPDALPHIGLQRRITQYDTEPDASYRLRLQFWRLAWKLAGGHLGEMLQLQPYFQPFAPMIRIVHQCGDGTMATWHTLDSAGNYSVYHATPSNWNWDGVSAQWSRFWVIIYLPGLASGAHWDDGIAVWDDGVTLWDGIAAQEIADIVAIINEWKAAHSILWGVILASDPASFDPTASPVILSDGTSTLPDGKWGSLIDPGTGFNTRLDTASYVYDLGHG